MIKTLERKYILTASLAIAILLVILLGAINVANFIAVRTHVEQTLDVILSFDGEAENLRQPGKEGEGDPGQPHGPHFDGPIKPQKNDYDTFMSSNFWLVRYDAGGEVVKTDVSRTSTVPEETALELAAQVMDGDDADGRVDNYRYRVAESRDGLGKTVVFLDVSTESGSYLRVLLLSMAGGILCWLLMLPIVVLLSKAAIRPIAENVERQRRFITDAGHEINTPLAIVRANVEAMELIQGETKWSRNILQQTERLSGLMKNLLLLARMDEGAAATQPERVLIGEVAAEIAQGFCEPFSQKGVDFVVNIAGEPAVTADRAQLSQLVSIFLENALKYTNDGGSVRLSIRENESRVRLSCTNTCTALPEGPLDKLFDRFYRSDASRSQKTGGYGIGLSVAKSIAQANGAAISAHAESTNAISFEVDFKSC